MLAGRRCRLYGLCEDRLLEDSKPISVVVAPFILVPKRLRKLQHIHEE